MTHGLTGAPSRVAFSEAAHAIPEMSLHFNREQIEFPMRLTPQPSLILSLLLILCPRRPVGSRIDFNPMPKRQRPKRALDSTSSPAGVTLAPPRIVGGHLRGRKLLYSGDPLTRPMKDRVREAVFNLVGPQVKGKHAIDLFAGTGALGFEALSRGAARATLVDRHFPTADLIRHSAAQLGVSEQCRVVAADTFIWVRRDLPTDGQPWVVFVSPPWVFFRERAAEMAELIATCRQRSPAGSLIVIEADQQFDFAALPQPSDWDVREYFPAVVGVLRKAEG